MQAAQTAIVSPLLSHHLPVMTTEVRSILQPRPGMDFLDGTVGGGGHAVLLLEANAPGGRLVGLDCDAHTLAIAKERLADFSERCVLIHDNFTHALDLVLQLGWGGVDGVLLDLGFSSLQVEDAERGFSFLRSGPLDMRMDQRQAWRAADLISAASEAELKRIFVEFGEEPAAGPLARALVRARAHAPLRTTSALAAVIGRVVRRSPAARVHPATRAFQALRIAVNRELEHLAVFLREGYRLLRPGGRMVILAYHSLEDRLVKEAFRRWAASCVCPPRVPVCCCGWCPQVRIVTPKPLSPTADEIARNPRARSARLRAVERLAVEKAV